MKILNCIYKIYSKTQPFKFYIGSAVDFTQRKNRHKTSLKHNWHANPILQNHYNKYGCDDLIYEVLESDIEKCMLLQKEQFYIDTLNPTINILKVAGSRLGAITTEETKKKLSDAYKKRIITYEDKIIMSERMKGNKHRIGAKHSDETKKEMSLSRVGNNWAKGAVRTQEFKDNLSKINKGKSPCYLAYEKSSLARSKKVIQYTLSGEFIKEWDSANKAKIHLGIKHVGCCCKGKRKTSGGYKWEYKNQ
jgi:group I intron endonuclease